MPFELLPAIDIRGGRVVRLLRGDFAAETDYGGDPIAVARAFVDAGARWLHVVDLDGARDPAAGQRALVKALISTVRDAASVEVAGGIRDQAAVDDLLAAGAARIVFGTAALRDPGFAAAAAERVGPERLAVALDIRDGRAVGHGWRDGDAGVDPEDALRTLAGHGIGTFEVTAIERDGTLAGPALEALGRLVGLGSGEVVASGGIATGADITAVRSIGCAGAIVGRALYEGRLSLEEALAAAR